MTIIPDSSVLSHWRKSSYSNGEGASCVEVSDRLWRKSSYSNGDGAECVEVADCPHGLLPVRDSKNPDGPALTFGSAAWTSFVNDIKDGGGR